ncbi:MAG: VWA domain-containing protein [Anaerolineae bacterium]|nr:VWA domain-containing protein [Thermoflexales bacterium]MDW8394983.1 VWA domain-containing protein [Anaerolineae bacterium]
MVTFDQPAFLALLGLIPLSVLIALPRLRVRVGQGGARMRLNKRVVVSLTLRSALVTCLACALAGMQVVQPAERLTVVFLVDASDSVGRAGVEQAQSFIAQALRAMRSDGQDRAAVVLFGANTAIERAPSSDRTLQPFSALVRSTATDLEQAIRLGMSLGAGDSNTRLVLITDGKETRSDGAAAARLAQALGVEVSGVLLPSRTGADVWVERVETPSFADVGQVVPVRIIVQSNQLARAQLSVFADGQLAEQRMVNLVAGQNEFESRFRALQPGLLRFTAQIKAAQDIEPQNDILASATLVLGPPRVLIVEQPGSEESTALRAALQAVNIAFDMVEPRALPNGLQELSRYQSVVLVNVPARLLSERAMLALQRYVRDFGGGLVAVGGPNSFGIGGYFGTALEATLPVESAVRDMQRFPSVSIVIVMDKSGSMTAEEGGVLKLRLAAEAAARVAELANDDDEVTVIAFDTQPVEVIGPFEGRDRSAYLDQILSIAPGGGGIYVYESLLEAEKVVAQTKKRSRFIILLADGNDAENQTGAPELVRRMRETYQATLTVVSIGDGADVPFLKALAETGGGRFHLTDKAANLPTIFTEEAALAKRSYLVEKPLFPKRGAASSILAGIAEMPALLGYIATTPKQAAQVVLLAEEGDPLLAVWQYGLGRAAAFTSDASGRWARNWLSWRSFPQFWAQLVRWTMVERQRPSFQVTAEPRGDRVLITAEEAVELPRAVAFRATLLDAEGNETTATLSPIAPGRYQAEVELSGPGAYLVRANRGGDQEQVLLPYVQPYSPEYLPNINGADKLREIIALGGGRLLDNPADAFRPLDRPIFERREVAQTLLMLAALLLPADIAVRRLSFGRPANQPLPQVAPAQAGVRPVPLAAQPPAPVASPSSGSRSARATTSELLRRRQAQAQQTHDKPSKL